MKEKREAPMSPSLMIAIGFALLILLVTLLLMLPISSQSRTVTPPLTALFTATSAVCVTGQALVDTGTHWSLFGQVVLIIAIQIGGLGVMKALHQYTSIPIITKVSDGKELATDLAQRQFHHDILAAHIYESVIADKYQTEMQNEYTRPIIKL